MRVVTALVVAVMFWRISVAGVTTGLWGGAKILPASPITAVLVLGGGIWIAYRLFSIGKRDS